MHSRGILHRDIQLANCTIGLPPNETTIYMIDFGFSKRYIDPRTHRHIPEGKGKRDFIGNYWFRYVNATDADITSVYFCEQFCWCSLPRKGSASDSLSF